MEFFIGQKFFRKGNAAQVMNLQNLFVTFTNGKLEKTLQRTADLISLIKEVFR